MHSMVTDGFVKLQSIDNTRFNRAKIINLNAKIGVGIYRSNKNIHSINSSIDHVVREVI